MTTQKDCNRRQALTTAAMTDMTDVITRNNIRP